jgi:hypothetical protein
LGKVTSIAKGEGVACVAYAKPSLSEWERGIGAVKRRRRRRTHRKVIM